MSRSDPPSPARRRLRRLRRFVARPLRDQLLVLRAGSVLVAWRIALVLLDFGTVRRLARRLAPRAEQSVDPERADRLVWAVWRASELIPTGRNCLLRSLAVHHLLAREGLRSSLRIGVKPDSPEGFAAHAWVEVGGRVVTREGRGVEDWAAFEDRVLGES